MFTSILANVGIGVGIAIVLFVILAMTKRDTMHYVNYNGDEQFRGKQMVMNNLEANCLTVAACLMRVKFWQ